MGTVEIRCCGCEDVRHRALRFIRKLCDQNHGGTDGEWL